MIDSGVALCRQDRESQLLRQATKAGIDSPLELANFMAQAGHESRG
jgi:putative chitinase